MANDILYFDSSALIKKFVDEKGTTQVNDLMNNCKLILISDFTVLECITVIRRYLKDHLIDNDLFQYIKQEILEEVSSMEVINLSESIIDISLSLLDNFYLKTLDNLQIASALTSVHTIDGFVSSDIKLNKIAKELNLNVINPVLI